jgi:hypothetical protein
MTHDPTKPPTELFERDLWCDYAPPPFLGRGERAGASSADVIAQVYPNITYRMVQTNPLPCFVLLRQHLALVHYCRGPDDDLWRVESAYLSISYFLSFTPGAEKRRLGL